MAQNASTPATTATTVTTTATTANNGSSAATGNPGNPGNTMMAAGKVRYCSIFTQYQRLNQQTVTPWRESNDAVHQAGGWRALAREARAPESASMAASMTQAQNCPPGVAAAHGEKP